jgi:ATP-binding cassette subfamily B protein
MQRLILDADGGRTAIVIAHRLSTVRMLDRILVFEHGAVVEEGRHEELVQQPGGVYKRLFERQALGLLPDSHQDRDRDEDEDEEAAEEAELSA